MEKQHIFLSYAREDIKIAERIFSDLTKYGLNVWFDKKSLLPGQRWKLEVKKGIQNSTHFIALLSSNSVNKRGYVQKELLEALEILDTIPESEIFIIPIRLDKCEFSNERLKDLHWIDLFESYETGIQSIIKVIEINDEFNDFETVFSEETEKGFDINKWLDSFIEKYDKAIYTEKGMASDDAENINVPENELIGFKKNSDYIFKNVPQSISPESTNTDINNRDPKDRNEKTANDKLNTNKEKIVTPTLGEIYAAQGNYSKAIGVFEILRKKDPNNIIFIEKIKYLVRKLKEANEGHTN